jgi:hypothetical protein
VLYKCTSQEVDEIIFSYKNLALKLNIEPKFSKKTLKALDLSDEWSFEGINSSVFYLKVVDSFISQEKAFKKILKKVEK